jgi:hypothetical protein|tara:strand:+ start:327 stop:539 length:213 start_codon:yes stop_codon:yes gene_type:complete
MRLDAEYKKKKEAQEALEKAEKKKIKKERKAARKRLKAKAAAFASPAQGGGKGMLQKKKSMSIILASHAS